MMDNSCCSMNTMCMSMALYLAVRVHPLLHCNCSATVFITVSLPPPPPPLPHPPPSQFGPPAACPLIPSPDLNPCTNCTSAASSCSLCFLKYLDRNVFYCTFTSDFETLTPSPTSLLTPHTCSKSVGHPAS